MFYFTSSVSIDGYMWRDNLVAQEGDTWFDDDKPQLLTAKGSRARTIHPLEENPTLFEQFIKLKTENDEDLKKNIVKFANKYGLLGQTRLMEDRNYSEITLVEAERFNMWKNEIAEMNITYRLWDCVEKRRVGELELLIHWDETDTAPLVGVTWEAVTKSNFKGFLSLKNILFTYLLVNSNNISFYKKDIISLAKFFLLTMVNRKLRGNVSPAILRDQAFNLHPYFNPSDLLSAMWFQLFEAVTGLKKFVRCDICGELLVIEKNNRSTKSVHTRCSKNRSDKKRKGLRLYQEGLTLPEIIENVDEKPELIEKWFAEWLEGGK